jgi:hypothetical protein
VIRVYSIVVDADVHTGTAVLLPDLLDVAEKVEVPLIVEILSIERYVRWILRRVRRRGAFRDGGRRRRREELTREIYLDDRLRTFTSEFLTGKMVGARCRHGPKKRIR